MTPVRKYSTASCLAVGLLLLAGACGGSTRPDSLSSTPTAATHGAPGSTQTTVTGGGSTPTSSSPSGSRFLRAPGRAGFVTPSGNINCEIDYASGSTANAAFCETI